MYLRSSYDCNFLADTRSDTDHRITAFMNNLLSRHDLQYDVSHLCITAYDCHIVYPVSEENRCQPAEAYSTPESLLVATILSRLLKLMSLQINASKDEETYPDSSKCHTRTLESYTDAVR